MAFTQMVKDVANRVMSKVPEKVSDIAKAAEAVPSAKSASSEVGSMYKRLTASDIEEDKKKKIGMKKGGKVSSASKRADGIAIRGKTRA